MRPLPLLVLGESAILAVLGSLWLATASSQTTAAPAPNEGSDSDAGDGSHASGAPAAESASRTEAEPDGSPGIGILVRGRVLAAAGAPAPKDASVTFRRGSDYRGGTVAADRYAVVGLEPGAWMVEARADGFATHRASHAVAREAVQTLDIVLERAHKLSVFLRTTDGGPLEATLRNVPGLWGLHVIATEQPLTGDLPATENSSVFDLGVGRYRRAREGVGGAAEREAADGELQLDRPPPANAALLLRHVVLAQQLIVAGQEKLTFTLDPGAVTARLGTVKLRIIDGKTGQPMTDGAAASFATAQGGASSAKPDATGMVVAAALIPGHLALTISGKDRETIWTLVRVPAGGVLDLGDVTLHAAIKLKGRLLDEDGNPVAGSVRWTDLDTMTFPRQLVGRRSAVADGDGDFEIWGAGPRRYIVSASTQDGRIGSAVFDARGGAVKPFEVRLARPVDITLAVGGSPFVGYTVTVRDRQGVPIAACRIEARWREPRLAVPPGEYTLEVHGDDDRLLKRVPIRAVAAAIRVEVP
jgi:protocatechuate 3,4-dioxygenase beta subunit